MKDKAGFVELTIGNHINVLSGYPFNSLKFSNEDGVPLIRIRDLLTSKTETYFNGEYSNQFLINVGDILVGMDGDFHIVKWRGKNALLNQRILKIYQKQGAEIDVDYLFYFLQPFLLEVNYKTAATTVKHLSVNDITKAIAEFPPLTEQQKIAKILRTVDGQIEKTEAIIAKYKAIKQGLMKDLFTRGIDVATGKLRPCYQDAPELYKSSPLGMIPKEWDSAILATVASIVSGGTPSTNIEEYWKGGDVCWVTPSDMTTNNEELFLSDSQTKITEKGLISSSAKLLPTNTLLMTSRATLGEIKIAQIPMCTNQGFKSLVISSDNHYLYYYYFMKFSKGRYSNFGMGSTFLEVNKKDTESFAIVRPTYKEQEMIGERLVAVDKKLSAERKNLSKYKEIKKGLMSDLLSGKVRVQVDEEVVC